MALAIFTPIDGFVLRSSEEIELAKRRLKRIENNNH